MIDSKMMLTIRNLASACKKEENQFFRNWQAGGIGNLLSKWRVHLLFGLILLPCIILGYVWQVYKGSWLDWRISMTCADSGGDALLLSANSSGGDALLLSANRNKTNPLDDLEEIELPRMIYTKPQVFQLPRSDVLTMTPWFAPIVWEGTYNLEILNEQFRQRNVTVGLTVFAIKKYVVFLRKFIETAEIYFMVGHRVNYYVFTDRPQDVPNITLKEGRQIVSLQVQNYPRWQEISMRRMEMINHFSQERFIYEVDYLVCVDVDMRFSDQVGVEILSELFGTLHPGFYAAPRNRFTYERRAVSQAYIPYDEGDFYYAGGFFGGTVPEVYKLTKKCHKAIMADKEKKLEAIWQEESHLNKYFVYHKPTKILSPEYLWDNNIGSPAFLKKKRFLAVPKNHAAIRNKRSLAVR
ncbi:histo-blood group ABO system transferase isoform X3 [Hemicordylus capensis]|uniref:histo-blood group ABO system transferase isoform X3 n=1 Tax=Hemicordylus capensis TaxID=884348 RepID=UPI002303CE4C|nr:histo-blood group ABO system transferase isoform X3 [Hemicordylus capensis]